jgi:hypothetical protein
MKHVLLAAAAVFFGAAPATADQVRFTGNTTADTTLIRDALQNILLVGQAQLKCTSLEAVEATILSPKYRPPEAYAQPDKRKSTYESWNATLCGRPTKFLITFWPADDGGTMFAVGYPYPRDAP